MGTLLPSGVVLVSVLVMTGCQTSPDASTPPPPRPLTFTKHIAPILFEHCAPCHRPGQPGPFSVLAYPEVRQHARQIAGAIGRRSMPPWQPEPGHGDFSNERRLTEDQIQTIQQWIQDGAIEGNPVDLPPHPQWPEGWQLGEPDLVVEMPQPYTAQPGGFDVFRNFVVPIPVATARYVRAVEFRPGSPKIVHHATLFIDPKRSSRRLDDRDPGPGYEGMLTEGVYTPDGHFLAWTPGRAATPESEDLAWRLDTGTDLVIQLHLMPPALPELVRASVGFFFTERPPTRTPFILKLGSKTIDIPAGARDHVVRDTYVLPVDVELLSVYPHAHHLARDIRAVATLPDGTTQPLIWIKNWDFRWQDVYRYRTPVLLPRGTIVAMAYTYDNSPANSRHLNHPPRRVMYGPQSSDEMGDLWLQVLPRNTTDLAILRSDSIRRELQADVAYAEMMVRLFPESERHNLLGARYLEAGRLEDAIAQLMEALRLKPDSAEAHNNLGNALQWQGRLAEAVGHFREAVRLKPGDARMHFHLGNALHAVGRPDEAIAHFRRATLLDPEFDQAHNNLGVALGSQGEIDSAIRHLRRAVELTPHYDDAHSNLGLALALRGEREAAIRHFRRALEIRPDHADAQRHLRELLESGVPNARGGPTAR